MAAGENDEVARESDLATLKAIYERLGQERDRLRDARGFFARPLGAAPASAGISTALVATIGSDVDAVFIWLATGTLGLLVLCGIVYDGLPAYRHLYARTLRRVESADKSSPVLALIADRVPADGLAAIPTPGEWYRAVIALEVELIGAPRVGNRWRPPWGEVTNLQDGLDAERTGLRTVQILWALVILFLVLAKLA